jgi:GDPmannose 4,6-dehydratase
MCVNYRNAYQLFISNGILFNHESPRRGENFVTSKVVREAVKISLGLSEKLSLGTLSSSRDWGHAKDYVKAMWMILQHDEPDDFICSTGVNHTIKDLCEYTFKKLGLDYREYVVIDENFSRPEETRHLKGDSTKLRTIINWEPSYSFETMIDQMIEHYKEKYGKN